MLSLIFSACTSLRRMFLMLPDALLRAQPGSRVAVDAHLGACPVRWDLAELTGGSLQCNDYGACQLEMLRGPQPDVELQEGGKQARGQKSVEEDPPKLHTAASSERGDLPGTPPSLKPLASARRRPRGRLSAALDALQDRTGITRMHLALAVQVGGETA